MKKILCLFVVLSMLLCPVFSAEARVSVGISIGINLPVYPQLVPVPGYPVYYAPHVSANYFFYDGMYWVYQNDNWYSSYWYNGPWIYVEPMFVPLFILRIPVRYYLLPPVYFRGWHHAAPPRWGHHWGRGWEEKRRGWDRWNHNKVPARAPVPSYQREYTGDRYPKKVEQQKELHNRSYQYQPRDKAVREQWKRYPAQKEPAREPVSVRPARQEGSPVRAQQDGRGVRDGRDDVKPLQRTAPSESSPPPPQRQPAVIDRKQDRKQQPGPAHQERQDPRLRDLDDRPQGKDKQQEQKRGWGKGQDRDDDRDRDRGDRGRGRDHDR